jgi:Arc/MetJ-type ribon-helix-helix transcriptional regulator
MTISLSPDYEKLIQQKVQSGEFPTAEAVVEFALNRLMSGGEQTPALTSEERVRILDEFFAEVDRDPVSDAPALPADALTRRHLYDDHRNRR